MLLKKQNLFRVVSSEIIRWVNVNGVMCPRIRIRVVWRGKRIQKTITVRSLLGSGDSNTKTRKNSGKGWMTAGLSLTPSDQGGHGDLCIGASAGCRLACLNETGLGSVYKSNQLYRAAKTAAWFLCREWFEAQLIRDLKRFQRKAAAAGKKLCVRLNMFSDIAWECEIPEIFEQFPDVQFYDYTKRFNRVNLPSNYSLTYSRAEHNHRVVMRALHRGDNVAVVFAGDLPKEWNGFRVISGDDTDLRFEDPSNVVIGLKLKSPSNDQRNVALETGFAVSA